MKIVEDSHKKKKKNEWVFILAKRMVTKITLQLQLQIIAIIELSLVLSFQNKLLFAYSSNKITIYFPKNEFYFFLIIDVTWSLS